MTYYNEGCPLLKPIDFYLAIALGIGSNLNHSFLIGKVRQPIGKEQMTVLKSGVDSPIECPWLARRSRFAT